MIDEKRAMTIARKAFGATLTAMPDDLYKLIQETVKDVEDNEMAELRSLAVKQQGEIIEMTNELVNRNDFGGKSAKAVELENLKKAFDEVEGRLRYQVSETKGWIKKHDEKKATIRSLRKEIKVLKDQIVQQTMEGNKKWYSRLFGF